MRHIYRSHAVPEHNNLNFRGGAHEEKEDLELCGQSRGVPRIGFLREGVSRRQ